MYKRQIVVRVGGAAEAESAARGAHAITGGTAGLGLLTGRWLAERGACAIMLASRSGALAADDGWPHSLAETGVRVAAVMRCDAAEAVDVRRLAADAAGTMPPLEGVWHAAGITADALLARQDARALRAVYAPKAHGAGLLHSALGAVALRACALFSSVAALLGGAGQANYAAANACLDALAARRRAHGRAAVRLSLIHI